MAAKLGLSEQQKVKIKEIFKQDRRQLEPTMTKLMAERHHLMELVHADKTDESAIRAQAVKLAGLEGDMAVQRARMFQQIRAVLTPQQLEKLKTIMKERGQRFGRFHGHFGKGMDRD